MYRGLQVKNLTQIISGGYRGEYVGFTGGGLESWTRAGLNSSTTNTYYYTDSDSGNNNNSSRVYVKVRDDWQATVNQSDDTITVKVTTYLVEVSRGNIVGFPGTATRVMKAFSDKGGALAWTASGSPNANVTYLNENNQVKLSERTFTLAPGEETGKGTIYYKNFFEGHENDVLPSIYVDEMWIGTQFRNTLIGKPKAPVLSLKQQSSSNCETSTAVVNIKQTGFNGYNESSIFVRYRTSDGQFGEYFKLASTETAELTIPNLMPNTFVEVEAYSLGDGKESAHQKLTFMTTTRPVASDIKLISQEANPDEETVHATVKLTNPDTSVKNYVRYGYRGKSLFVPLQQGRVGSFESNVQPDGSIMLNGTTNNSWGENLSAPSPIELKKGKQYTFLLDAPLPMGLRGRFVYKIPVPGSNPREFYIPAGKLYTAYTPDGDINNITLYFSFSGERISHPYTFNSTRFKLTISEGTAVNDAISDYHEQSVAIAGTAKIISKNMIYNVVPNTTTNGLTHTISPDGTITTSGTPRNDYSYITAPTPDLTIKKGETVTLSVDKPLPFDLFIGGSEAGGGYSNLGIKLPAGQSKITGTAQTTKNVNCLIAGGMTAGQAIASISYKAQLERGVVATTISSYHSGEVALPDDIGLYKLTDDVYDEVKAEDGRIKLVKKVGKLELNGEENTISYYYTSKAGAIGFKYKNPSNEMIFTQQNSVANIICSHFDAINEDAVYTTRENKTGVAIYGGYSSFPRYSNTIGFWFTAPDALNLGITDVASFKNWLKAEKDKGTPVTVYYELCDHQEADLGAAEYTDLQPVIGELSQNRYEGKNLLKFNTNFTSNGISVKTNKYGRITEAKGTMTAGWAVLSSFYDNVLFPAGKYTFSVDRGLSRTLLIGGNYAIGNGGLNYSLAAGQTKLTFTAERPFRTFRISINAPIGTNIDIGAFTPKLSLGDNPTDEPYIGDDTSAGYKNMFDEFSDLPVRKNGLSLINQDGVLKLYGTPDRDWVQLVSRDITNILMNNRPYTIVQYNNPNTKFYVEISAHKRDGSGYDVIGNKTAKTHNFTADFTKYDRYNMMIMCGRQDDTTPLLLFGNFGLFYGTFNENNLPEYSPYLTPLTSPRPQSPQKVEGLQFLDSYPVTPVTLTLKDSYESSGVTHTKADGGYIKSNGVTTTNWTTTNINQVTLAPGLYRLEQSTTGNFNLNIDSNTDGNHTIAVVPRWEKNTTFVVDKTETGCYFPYIANPGLNFNNTTNKITLSTAKYKITLHNKNIYDVAGNNRNNNGISSSRNGDNTWSFSGAMGNTGWANVTGVSNFTPILYPGTYTFSIDHPPVGYNVVLKLQGDSGPKDVPIYQNNMSTTFTTNVPYKSAYVFLQAPAGTVINDTQRFQLEKGEITANPSVMATLNDSKWIELGKDGVLTIPKLDTSKEVIVQSYSSKDGVCSPINKQITFFTPTPINAPIFSTPTQTDTGSCINVNFPFTQPDGNRFNTVKHRYSYHVNNGEWSEFVNITELIARLSCVAYGSYVCVRAYSVGDGLRGETGETCLTVSAKTPDDTPYNGPLLINNVLCQSLSNLAELICEEWNAIKEDEREIYTNDEHKLACDGDPEDPTLFSMLSRIYRFYTAINCLICSGLNDDFNVYKQGGAGKVFIGSKWVAPAKNFNDKDTNPLVTSGAIYDKLQEAIQPLYKYFKTYDYLVSSIDHLASSKDVFIKGDVALAKTVEYTYDGKNWIKGKTQDLHDFDMVHVNNATNYSTYGNIKTTAGSGWYWYGGTWNQLDASVSEAYEDLSEYLKSNFVSRLDNKKKIKYEILNRNVDGSVTAPAVQFDPTSKTIYFITEEI
nr:MAG TPA: hypothetical protein [Caudoviricetes sp.]